MALIACPEVWKRISNQAPACIHCSCPLAQGAPPRSNRFSVVLTAAPEDSEGRYHHIRKARHPPGGGVWGSRLRVSLPARGRRRPPPSDPSDPKGRLGAGRHPPRGGGRGAGARLHHARVPSPIPSGCRAMDFGKTVAAVILGVLAAQLILLPWPCSL